VHQGFKHSADQLLQSWEREKIKAYFGEVPDFIVL
jgi:hypothetical protein